MRIRADKEWVEAAMEDDSLVVELLVTLHRRKVQPVPPMKWTVRQRRSKSVSVGHKLAHRASPTTPLSWSDATDGGAGGGGFEESTRLRKLVGSKANIDSEKTVSKRSRKKKTLAELRDEQMLLLKERRQLKREILAAHENLERQRARNATLKRMKIEMLPGMDPELICLAEEATCSQDKPESRGCHPSLHTGQLSVSQNDHQSSTPDSGPEKPTVVASDPKFILPDLNIPVDEPNSDTITGVSQLDSSKFLGK